MCPYNIGKWTVLYLRIYRHWRWGLINLLISSADVECPYLISCFVRIRLTLQTFLTIKILTLSSFKTQKINKFCTAHSPFIHNFTKSYFMNIC